MTAGWRTATLEDVCDEITDGSHFSPKTTAQGYPYVTVRDIDQDGQIDFGKCRFVSDEDYKALLGNGCKPNKGDVLFSKDGTVGKVALIDYERDFVVLSSLAIVRPDHQMVDSAFLKYMMKSPAFLEEAVGKKTGVAIRRIILRNLKSITIPVPPLGVQQRIVSILDEAFAGIATAKANAEKQLANARALLESRLDATFRQPREKVESSGNEAITHSAANGGPKAAVSRRPDTDILAPEKGASSITRTGGRRATLRRIPGDLSLAVGKPDTQSRNGWHWRLLTDLARLESGHTPSRRHPEYWGGSIPWIGIQDARDRHGRRIDNTVQTVNDLGIANSSARLLPANTVCLSRTASVGYVVVLGRPMATSQDFVNWVCSKEIVPAFLQYLFLAEGRRGLLRFASGSVHQTIYFPEVKAFHICLPDPAEQRRLVAQLDLLRNETEHLEAVYRRKLDALEALKSSLLHEAFTGQL